MPGVAKDTLTKLFVSVGNACAEYHDRNMRHVHARRIQCDEIWQFCYAKAKNVPADKQGQFGFGAVRTWVAIDADTELVPSFMGAGAICRRPKYLLMILRAA
jgi:hypothetical protein